MVAQPGGRSVGELARSCWLLRGWAQTCLLTLVVGLTFFSNLGEASPSLMEARNFISVREITSPGGNWLLPTLNGDIRVAKPPLPTWISATAGRVAGDIGNVAALRFPAAVMSALMVLFLYLLARQLTQDRLLPFLAALVLAGSLTLFNTGRQGTWDIYCHSFMLGALWLLARGLKKRSGSTAYGAFLVAGLLMGCSFLSKGPVAFYAMLLPFALSYVLCFGRKELMGQGKGLLLTFSVCLLVSLPWPLYVAITAAEAFTRSVAGESTAWLDRHVKPFWYYWGFVAQAGIWTVFAGVALFVPYTRKRINQLAPYRFLVFWVLLTVLLLSVVPEKKERYLLPVMAPLALLTGAYMCYLLKTWSSGQAKKWDQWIMACVLGLLGLLCCALPVAAYTLFYRPGLISTETLALMVAMPLVLGAILLLSTRRKRGDVFLLAVVWLNVFVLVVGVPVYLRAFEPSDALRGLGKVKEAQELKGLSFYAVGEMSPTHIWEVGKQVKPLQLSNQHLEVPNDLPAVVFSLSPLSADNLSVTGMRLQLFRTFKLEEEPLKVYFVYVLSEE